MLLHHWIERGRLSCIGGGPRTVAAGCCWCRWWRSDRALHKTPNRVDAALLLCIERSRVLAHTQQKLVEAFLLHGFRPHGIQEV